MTSFITSNKGTNTTTATTHAIGDLLLVGTTRNASATPPSLPSGYTSINTNTTTLYSSRTGYRIATSTSDTTGTWTNATETIIQVYRATAGNFPLIGSSATNKGTVTPISYPALTLTGSPNAGSWVACFGGVKGASTNIGGGNASMTIRQDEVGTGELVGSDTNAIVASWSAVSQAVTGTITEWITWSIEIEDYKGVVIDAVSTSGIKVSSGGTSPQTLSTLTAGASVSCLVCQLSFSNGGTGTLSTPSAAPTWNSVSMTLIGNKTGSDGFENIYTYGMINPATGNNTLSVSFSPTIVATGGLLINAWSFKGSDVSTFANCFPAANVTTDASTPAGAVYPASAFSISTVSGDAICAGYSDGSGSNTSSTYPTNTGTLIYNDTSANDNGAAWRGANSTTTTLQFTGGSSGAVTAGVAFRIQQPQTTGVTWAPYMMDEMAFNAQTWNTTY